MASKLKRIKPRRRAQTVYVVITPVAPVAAFATIGDAQTFVEMQPNSRYYSICRLAVSTLVGAMRTMTQRRDAFRKLLDEGIETKRFKRPKRAMKSRLQ